MTLNCLLRNIAAVSNHNPVIIMKNSLLFAILLASTTLLAQSSTTSPNIPDILPILSTSVDGSMASMISDSHVQHLSSHHGYRRLLLMLIPASLLGALYIIVKKQKLYIEAIPLTHSTA